MTYNVHGCVGLDFRRSERRVAGVIADNAPEVVALQELDLGRSRSAGVDQAALIAERLGFHHCFHPAMQRGDEQYGDAILSRWPLRVRQAGELPSALAFPFRERRAVLWVECATDHGSWQLINTHFGVGWGERREQAAALAGDAWIGRASRAGPLVVAGDFNSPPASAAFRLLASAVTPARGAPTFPTTFPFLAIDHFFVGPRVAVHRCFSPRSLASRYASDHFPLVADLEWLGPGTDGADER